MSEINYSHTNKVLKDCVAENANHRSEIHTLIIYNPRRRFSLSY